MSKPLKIPPDNLYFTSDLHINHDKSFIWEKRGFNSVREHDEGVLEAINQTLNNESILFSLGDMFLNSSIEYSLSFLQRLRCGVLYIVYGNHESYLPKIYQQWFGESCSLEIGARHRFYDKQIVFLGHYAEISVKKQNIVLCHYPIAVWNMQKFGAWHLCGHSHGSYANSRPDSKIGKILDVGFDVFKKPVGLSQVCEIMQQKDVVSLDGHH